MGPTLHLALVGSTLAFFQGGRKPEFSIKILVQISSYKKDIYG